MFRLCAGRVRVPDGVLVLLDSYGRTVYNGFMPYKDKEKQRAYQARHYQENKERYQDSKKKSRRKVLGVVANLKRGSCVDCGGKFHPCAMQFDHIGDDKVAAIGRLKRSKGLDAVLEEIKKCELVCGNCHAVRSFKRALGLQITDEIPEEYK